MLLVDLFASGSRSRDRDTKRKADRGFKRTKSGWTQNRGGQSESFSQER